MKHVSLGGLDVSRIGLGAMTMAGTYTSGGGLDDAESIRPSTGRSSWASPTSTPPRSTARSTARKSSGAPSRTAATRWWWRPSSGSSPTPAADPASSTAAPPTSAPRSKAP